MDAHAAIGLGRDKGAVHVAPCRDGSVKGDCFQHPRCGTSEMTLETHWASIRSGSGCGTSSESCSGLSAALLSHMVISLLLRR